MARQELGLVNDTCTGKRKATLLGNMVAAAAAAAANNGERLPPAQ